MAWMKSCIAATPPASVERSPTTITSRSMKIRSTGRSLSLSSLSPSLGPHDGGALIDLSPLLNGAADKAPTRRFRRGCPGFYTQTPPQQSQAGRSDSLQRTPRFERGGLDARRVLGDREKGEDHLTARAHTGAREHARGLPMGVVDASARGG